jgi:hypothetical protein
MNRITQVLLFLVTAALLHVAPASGQAWSSDSLKPGDSCDFNKTDEWRCVLKGAGTGQVTLQKTALFVGKSVSFTTDEYHSGCGFGSKLTHSETVTIPANTNSTTFFALASGRDIGCREMFIVRCKVDGADGNCQEVLSASLNRFKGNQQ